MVSLLALALDVLCSEGAIMKAKVRGAPMRFESIADELTTQQRGVAV